MYSVVISQKVKNDFKTKITQTLDGNIVQICLTKLDPLECVKTFEFTDKKLSNKIKSESFKY